MLYPSYWSDEDLQIVDYNSCICIGIVFIDSAVQLYLLALPWDHRKRIIPTLAPIKSTQKGHLLLVYRELHRWNETRFRLYPKTPSYGSHPPPYSSVLRNVSSYIFLKANGKLLFTRPLSALFSRRVECSWMSPLGTVFETVIEQLWTSTRHYFQP